MRTTHQLINRLKSTAFTEDNESTFIHLAKKTKTFLPTRTYNIPYNKNKQHKSSRIEHDDQNESNFCSDDSDGLNEPIVYDYSDSEEEKESTGEYHWPDQSDSEDEFYNLDDDETIEVICKHWQDEITKMNTLNINISNINNATNENQFAPIHEKLVEHILTNKCKHKRCKTVIIYGNTNANTNESDESDTNSITDYELDKFVNIDTKKDVTLNECKTFDQTMEPTTIKRHSLTSSSSVENEIVSGNPISISPNQSHIDYSFESNDSLCMINLLDDNANDNIDEKNPIHIPLTLEALKQFDDVTNSNDCEYELSDAESIIVEFNEIL